MTNRELITTLLSYPMKSDIYLVCEDPIRKKDVIFPIKGVERFTSVSTHIRFNDSRPYTSNEKCECDKKPAYDTEAMPYEQSKKNMERISGIKDKEEPSNPDVEKELKKLIDIVMIGSLLKSLNPDDKED